MQFYDFSLKLLTFFTFIFMLPLLELSIYAWELSVVISTLDVQALWGSLVHMQSPV